VHLSVYDVVIVHGYEEDIETCHVYRIRYFYTFLTFTGPCILILFL